MDFKRKSIRRSLIRPSFYGQNDAYPHFMQLYKIPPSYEISFKEFEESTAERLSVLQTIDEVNARGLKGEEWRNAVKEELLKQPELRVFLKLMTATSLGSVEADFLARKRDHISHYVMRLAYCDTEEKRRWFISREIDLFKLRWMSLNSDQKNEFLLYNNLNYDQLSEQEKMELIEDSSGMIKQELVYYKVHFVLIPEHVSQRRVFLKKGTAFINSDDVISVILSSYRSQLSQSLAYASRRLPSLDEDERIFSMLKGAGKTARDVQYNMENKEAIDIADLDKLAETSYPLCMQHIHHILRQENHLKYFCRLQYGLFLKGIGVTMEDCLKFFRIAFSKKIDAETFNKKYSYGFRHSFGQEGKRANYSPHSCLKIINGSFNPGDHHGCPFRHKDVNTVKKVLSDNGLSTLGSQEVLDLMRKGHFQLACSKYFQLKHSVDNFVVNHPNRYFDESVKILSGKAPVKKETPSVSNHTPKSTQDSAKVDEWGVDDSGFDFAAVEVMDTL